MDLLATLRNKIDTIGDGDHAPGLRSVLLHIETAFRHLERGQSSGDETAFTDAIYRTNQAFEGSIKEAYRVLTGKPPEHKRPFDIENYLEQNAVFRPRVLSQFTNYRTEWRNSSTHDYKLDFDEGEAFLAIVSVTAFACLLSDQIAERLAFVASKVEAERNKKKLKLDLRKAGDKVALVDSLADALLAFSRQMQVDGQPPIKTESQLIGTLSGFLSALSPDYRLTMEETIAEGRGERADLVVRSNEEVVILELKRSPLQRSKHSALAQLEHYLLLSGSRAGILYFASDSGSEYEITTHYIPRGYGRILVIAPKPEG